MSTKARNQKIVSLRMRWITWKNHTALSEHKLAFQVTVGLLFLITASHCGHVRHFNKREEKVNVLSKGKTLFYLFICIYLLERVIERMRAKDLSATGSLLKWLEQPSWVRLKAGAGSSFRIRVWVKGAWMLGPSSAATHISRDTAWKWNCGAPNEYTYAMLALQLMANLL